jgi:hypothetical protein
MILMWKSNREDHFTHVDMQVQYWLGIYKASHSW